MFTGRRFDIETGLYYYRARYYNPHIGRFMQTDPVGYADGINWYAYCGNNPLAYVDPSGLCYYDPCDPCDVICPEQEIMDLEEELRKKTRMIIEELEESAWDYVVGISGGGKFDFKENDPDAIFLLGDGTELTASEFGNYLAGYGAFYHFGAPGVGAVIGAGHLYAFIEKTTYPIFADEPWLEYVKNPPEGTLWDGSESQEWIGKGVSGAIESQGDFWRWFSTTFVPSPPPFLP
jgi:RHS repeat-associated protein